MPENRYDLLRLPEEIFNKIRRAFTNELGFTFQAPGKIAIYPYGEKQYAIYNMGDKEAPVSLRFSGKIEKSGWKEIVNGLPVTIKEIEPSQDHRFPGMPVLTDVSLKVKPFQIAIVQAP
jgi:hypothetical protein